MERQILLIALAILALGLAFNLHLSLAVMRRLRQERDSASAAAPRPGDAVAPVAARGLDARAWAPLLPVGQACALLFLSSKCPKCTSHLPELAAMLDEAAAAGLALRIASIEPAFRLRRFLAGTPLAAIARRLRLRDYRLLNPQFTAPAYLFVDHDGTVQAAGLVGDADWQGLREQLSGVAVVEVEAA